jgi:hypothetical protein
MIAHPQVRWEESWIEFYVGARRRVNAIRLVIPEEVLSRLPPQSLPANRAATSATQPISETTDKAKANEELSDEGWQGQRVEKKLDELEGEDTVLKNHTPLELRRQVENKFTDERQKASAQKKTAPPRTPSTRVINRVIKKRLK